MFRMDHEKPVLPAAWGLLHSSAVRAPQPVQDRLGRVAKAVRGPERPAAPETAGGVQSPERPAAPMWTGKAKGACAQLAAEARSAYVTCLACAGRECCVVSMFLMRVSLVLTSRRSAVNIRKCCLRMWSEKGQPASHLLLCVRASAPSKPMLHMRVSLVLTNRRRAVGIRKLLLAYVE